MKRMVRLRRPGILQQRVKIFLDAVDFLKQFVASRIGDGEQDAGELGKGKQTESLPIINGLSGLPYTYSMLASKTFQIRARRLSPIDFGEARSYSRLADWEIKFDG
jgi:hypothetical protein